MRRLFSAITVLTLATTPFVLPINDGQVHAQPAPVVFRYAVKFVCGKSPTAGQPQVVATGNYFTAINVHNPTSDVVGLRKRFSVALPSEKSGPLSQFFNAELGPGRAFEVDCVDIWKHLHMQETFVKGFAVIESKVELDIVAVYTAAGANGLVQTMDVEEVQPRRVAGGGGSPDLIPAPDANGNFCRRDSAGRLIVTVRNLGGGSAGPSVVRVTYSNGFTATAPAPAVGAGSSVDVTVTFPGGCFTPDCGFRITVDSTSVVTETNEGNNTASGTCIG